MRIKRFISLMKAQGRAISFLPALLLSVGLLVGLAAPAFGAPAPQVSVKDYSQCANDDGDGYVSPPSDQGCHWTNGNLQSNNSRYYEGEATVQRVLLEDITIGTHTITFQYDTTKGGKHAYDFLTSDDFSELAPNPLTSADLCDGAGSSKLPSCASLSPSSSPTIPADPNAGGRDTAKSNRVFKIRNGAITNVTTPTIVTGSYAGDSDTAITVTFSVASNCANKYTVGSDNTPVCAALISFGAHISDSSDWTLGQTAVNIDGSPYHVALSNIDGNSIGQRDNQMQANAVVKPSTITIHKVVDPSSDTTTSFPFTTTGTGYNGFSLTGGTQNQQIVDPGTFTVTETNPSPAYALTNLVCTTVTGNGTSATTNLSTRTVSITIGSLGGGNVDCTYTNTKQKAHLTLVKTVTNDNGGTAAATDWTLSATGPTSISGATGSTAVTSAEVDSGNYALSESGGPGGYTGGTYSCVVNGGSAVSNNSVTLAAGDNATCTVNNDDNAPSLTLNKVVVNDNGGTAAESDWTLSATGPTSISGPGAAGNADVTSGASFDAGTYALSESGTPTGYSASAWSCTGGTQNGSNITVGLGESATCTITNDDIQPLLTLVKQVVNDNGGNAVVSDFPLFVSGTSVTSGTQNGFNAGSYTASETNQTGYTAGSWTGDCAADGSVTLNPGDVKTCTITNDDQPAHIILNKIVINDNGGTAGVNDFGLTVGGTGVNSGDNTTVNSNSAVALNEAGLAGYTFVSLTGDSKCPSVLGGTVTLDEGETVTCTITNDDQAGSLTIVKNTTGGDGTFDFTVTGPSASTPTVTTSSGTGTTGAVSVNAGSYSVAETVPTGWELTSASCNDGTSSFAASTVSSITVALGANVTCTFNNTKKPTLTIIKLVDPTNDNGLFNLWINGTQYATDVGNNGTTGAQYAVIGSNTFSESAGTGTDLSDYVPSVSGTGCGGTAIAGTITLAAGENKTCTITNTRKGHIIVDKVTVPAGDTQSFNFTATGTGYSNFSLTDAAAPNDQKVAPGTYSVAETVPTGWDQTSAVCDNGQTPGSINVAAGQTITCTFTNTKRGSITIVKDAQPNDLTDFSFTGTSPIGAFLLDDDAGVADIGLNGDVDRPQSKQTNNLVAGNYTVTETLPNSYWVLDSISCVDGSGASYTVTPVSGGVTIPLTAGANVTCTFVNKKTSPTRTLGFWQTHTAFTTSVFNANPPFFIGVNVAVAPGTHKGILTNATQVFGGFFASNSKLSNGKTARTQTDKARIVLLQQLLAAKLNCAQFGCLSSVQTLIATADANYASGNVAGMTVSTAALDAFNNSGDTIILGVNPGSATPAQSKSIADYAFWDQP